MSGAKHQQGRQGARAAVIGAAAASVTLALAGSAFAGDLDGRWAYLQRTVTASEVPVIGTLLAKRLAVSLLDLRHEDGRLRGTGQLCKLEVDSGTVLVSTTIPEAFRKLLPVPSIDAAVSPREGGGYTFNQAKRTLVLGAKLENPLRDPLPTGPSDPRVLDQDGDGQPGVTVKVGGFVTGSVYLVERTATWLSGTSTDRNELAGSVYFNHEQVILGASSGMLEDSPDAKPVWPMSRFRLVRLPAAATCATANELAASWATD
ncbi:MAG: hypothetical protein HY908_30140 [Myxococcales bacterium]|nr:hypothetical protein [Myxococcales bacterium]